MKPKKLMIWVASPPASGKTFVAKALCSRLVNTGLTPFYLDKDSLIPVSKQIFRAGGAIEDRSSAFFEAYIRDSEYEASLEISREGLAFADIAVISAPFTREMRSREKMDAFREEFLREKIKLFTVWVYCPKDVVKKRMIKRNSERDSSKIGDIDAYADKTDYSVPFSENPKDFFMFDNSSMPCFDRSLDNLIDKLFSDYAFAVKSPRLKV